MQDRINELILASVKQLGFIAGALGRQPNFAQFDSLEPKTLRDEACEVYLAEYRAGMNTLDDSVSLQEYDATLSAIRYGKVDN